MNKEEFGALYREHRKRLVRLMFRKGATLDEAEEIVQESFEELWKQSQDGKEFDSVIAFLYTVCKNKTLNLVTSSYKKQLVFKDDLDDEEFDGGTEMLDTSISNARLRGECVQEKMRLFESEHPERACAIRMQQQGFQVKEIAESISRTIEATRQYLTQTRIKLRPYLEECRD